MKISADEQKLFLAHGDGNLKLMSLIDGTTIKDFGQIHDEQITAIVITADEKFFFTSSYDGELKQWKYGDLTLVRYCEKFNDAILSMCS